MKRLPSCTYVIVLAMMTPVASAQTSNRGQAKPVQQGPNKAVHSPEDPTVSNPFNTVRQFGRQVATNSPEAQIDEEMSSLVDTFNDMIEERRYSEAEVVAKQVSELKPGSTIATNLMVISRLKNAESEADLSKVERDLTKLLARIFDQDLKRREKDVEGIRKRVAKLNQQVEKRRSSKDKVIDIQFRVQVNEAAGLGFTAGNPNQSSVQPSGSDPFGGSMGSSPERRGVFLSRDINRIIQRKPLISPDNFPANRIQTKRNSQALDDLSKAITALQSVTNADEKTDAQKTLKAALAAFFDADLKRRESEISGIQKRVETLEQQIKKRRDAKDEIVSLQLEVLKNEADGLGFFSNPCDSSSRQSRLASSRIDPNNGNRNFLNR